MKNLHGSNTDINKTELSNTDPISSYSQIGNDVMRSTYTAYNNYFVKQLEIETLFHDNPYETETINGMLDILVETCSSSQKEVWISGRNIPIEIVRGKLMKLTMPHIQYALDCFNSNTTYVKNIRQYLLTTLYNAPTTIGPYYRALVNHDMACGQI